MTTTAVIPTPAKDAPAVRAAHILFNVAVAFDKRTDEIDKLVIDRVIEHHANVGLPFSANSMRDDLPAVRMALVSRRLIAAQNRGLIRKVGYTPSTLPSTHGSVVAVYEPLDTT